MRNKKADFTLLTDIARMASGALGPLSEVKETLKKLVRERVDRVLYEMDFVSREEFEDLQASLQKSRLVQIDLEKRLKALEGKKTVPKKKITTKKTVKTVKKTSEKKPIKNQKKRTSK